MRAAFYLLFLVDLKIVQAFFGGPRTVQQIFFFTFTANKKDSAGFRNGAGGARETPFQFYMALVVKYLGKYK